jgi:2-hydroxy-4-carboxymuconate semialdehyde hemiacetal dehydrogenase
VNVCLVGYGSIARSHLQALAGEDVRLRSVMGRLPEPTAEFAAEFGFERHSTDLDEALADPAVDAVIITSPSDVHAAQTEKALRAGKHALVEIPLALNLTDADRLDRLAREVDRRLMVCHTQRYYPPLVEARRWIAEGRLHPYHVSTRYLFFRRENVNWAGRRRSWTDNLLWHHGGHAVDTSLWLIGADDVAVSSQVAPPTPHLNIPMDLDILARTPSGQLVDVSMSYNSKFSYNEYLIMGEETTLLATNQRLVTPDGVLLDTTTAPDSHPNPIRLQDREFLAAVREGREPAISPASIRPAVKVLQEVEDQRVRAGGIHANPLRRRRHRHSRHPALRLGAGAGELRPAHRAVADADRGGEDPSGERGRPGGAARRPDDGWRPLRLGGGGASAPRGHPLRHAGRGADLRRRAGEGRADGGPGRVGGRGPPPRRRRAGSDG